MLLKKILGFGFFLFLFAAVVVFGQEEQDGFNSAVLDEGTSGDIVKFDGYARMQILEGKESKPLALVFSADDWDYKTARALTEGSKFYMVVGARESAYTYTFTVSQPSPADDSFRDPMLVFPQPNISPLLGSNSEMILPAEDKAFSLDTEIGTEYLVILYAKRALDIRSIMHEFSAAEGSLIERLSAAIGDDLLFDVSYSETEAAFTAEANPRAVAVLVVAIEHR